MNIRVFREFEEGQNKKRDARVKTWHARPSCISSSKAARSLLIEADWFCTPFPPVISTAIQDQGELPVFGKISAKCCSFSAVSAPIFTRKYAFCSIFQNLPDYLPENFEIWQNFADFIRFCNICKIFAEFKQNFHKKADFSNRFFAKILRSQRCRSAHIL